MVKTFLTGITLSLLLIISATDSASAARSTGGTPTPLGIDISWPQCGKKVPSDQAFGIVGVNGGLANTTNPCLKDQLVWARQSRGGTSQEKIQLYVNTANPGGLNTESWPWNNTDPANNSAPNPHGTCDHEDTLACAWQYGWNRAAEDVIMRFKPTAPLAQIDANPASYIWWLDVETENTWKLGGTVADYQSNTAVLEGMTAYFNQAGIRVGLYSTAYQWGQIVGNAVSSASNLTGLPNWRPGGANLTTAKDACKADPLTVNGMVVLTQFIDKRLDYNYSCI